MNITDGGSLNPPRNEDAAPAAAGVPVSQPTAAAALTGTAPQPASPPIATSPPSDAPGPFIAGTDERCLWVDPLAKDLRVLSGSVLLGDALDDYVRKYNVLLDNKTDYDKGKLKAGSYTMTPDENEA